MANLLAKLKEKRPMTKTVSCNSWEGEKVTLRRLQSGDKIKVIDIYNQSQKDEDGKMSDQHEQMTFAVELLALSIVDQEGVCEFDSVDGREFLFCETDALGELTPIAMTMNQLTSDADAETEEAKKN